MKNKLCLLALTFTVGCATTIVNPYAGKQQAWPTASGALTIDRYKLPIYQSLPPRQYEVIAELRAKSSWVYTTEVDHVPMLVAKARALGADALLFVNGKKFFGKIYGPPTTTPLPPAGLDLSPAQEAQSFHSEAFGRETTILAIRWIHGPP